MALNVEYRGQPKRVKVTPGTTMFEVLEAARGQFQLDASRQFQLLHRSKPIDLSIPFRLTGISNNASVELKGLEGAAEVQQVRVCIQMQDGKRVQASFGSDVTIEHILIFFKLIPSPTAFSLGFLRREINAEAFSTTTLKELGILSGSAMFRVQASEGQPPSAMPISREKAPVPSEKPHVSFAPKPALPPTTSAKSPFRDDEDEEMAEDTEERPHDAEEGFNEPTMSSHDALQLLRDSCFDAVSVKAIMTLMKIVTNILSDPANEKKRAIRLANPAFHRSVGQVKGGLEFLKSIGFVLVPETQMLVLTTAACNKFTLEEGLRLLTTEADDLNISLDARPVVREKMEDPTFDVFRTQITRVQMQPRGPSTTEILVDALKTKQDQLVGKDKPPRNTVISTGGRESTPVDSFSIAGPAESEASDAQLLMSSLRTRREEMEKAKNFRTRSMRELEDLKRKKVFQVALIRVQFPDRAVMQAAFHPNETIGDVTNHVVECLDPLYKGLAFYLYVTPPMQKLAPEKTLAELNLVPAALMYLSWVSTTPEAETASVGFYLRGDLLTSDRAAAKESVDPLENAEYPKPLLLENPPADSVKPAPVAGVAPATAAAQAKSAKKPSWLKL